MGGRNRKLVDLELGMTRMGVALQGGNPAPPLHLSSRVWSFLPTREGWIDISYVEEVLGSIDRGMLWGREGPEPVQGRDWAVGVYVDS